MSSPNNSPAGLERQAAAERREALTSNPSLSEGHTGGGQLVPGHWEETTTPSRGKPVPVTSTVTTTKFDNGVVDISIIPYMRHKLVAFQARGLRPNRRVWFYFDNTDVTSYIISHDEITLTETTQNAAITSVHTANAGFITVGSGSANSATILDWGRVFDFSNTNVALQDNGDSRTRRRRLLIHRGGGVFAPGQNHTLTLTGNTGTIASYEARGAHNLKTWFTSSTSNTVVLPIRTKVMANNYWGTNGANTITFMINKNKRHTPFTANIVGFNNVTQTLTLSSATGTLANLVSASLTDPATQNTDPGTVSWTMGSTFYTDHEGKIAGTFAIPSGTFRTGERIFRIIDNLSNNTDDATTRAEYKFDSTGLQQTKQSISIAVTTPAAPVIATPPNRVWVPERRTDPIAQTFFVNSTDSPRGIYITSIDLFFRSKDNILPVRLEILPTDNGYPDGSSKMLFGSASVLSEHVNISDDATASTKFKFNTPVYLPVGEYAMVIKSDSLEYEVFVAELGAKKIGSNNIVSEQPYVGSFFKSQNSSTWTAIQLEDLMFVINKAVFSTSGTATFVTNLPTANNDITADAMLTHLMDTVYDGSAITYQHSYSGISATSYELENEFVPSSRVVFTSAGPTYNLIASLSTTDPDISPSIFVNTGKLITTQNYVDSANLAQSDFTVVTALGGFPANANVPLTITSAAGSGAVAYGNANSSGYLTSIQLAAGGSYYTDNVTVTIGANTGQIRVASETDAAGGPAMAKYISRSVTLAPGFDADDLKVYLTAYRPSGTDILVYYKIRSQSDPEPFEQKKWTQMITKNPPYSYEGAYKYAPTEYTYSVIGTENGLTGMNYTSGSATYTYFNQYAIKVVLLSNDTTKFPIVYDIRAIALPL